MWDANFSGGFLKENMHCKWPIKELTKNDLLLITPTRNLQQKTVTMKTKCRILPPKAYTYKVVKGKVSLKLTFQRAWGKMSEILFKTYLQTWYNVHADLTKLLWSQKKKKRPNHLKPKYVWAPQNFERVFHMHLIFSVVSVSHQSSNEHLLTSNMAETDVALSDWGDPVECLFLIKMGLGKRSFFSCSGPDLWFSGFKKDSTMVSFFASG